MAARSTQTKVIMRSARRAVRKVRNHGGAPNITAVKRLGEELSTPGTEPEYTGPQHLRSLRESYRPADGLPLVDGRVPLVWWTDTANYGDLLSPWLVGRVAQRPVVFAPPKHPSYVAVGSVVTRARGPAPSAASAGPCSRPPRSTARSAGP
jgi:hypothetical protein